MPRRLHSRMALTNLSDFVSPDRMLRAVETETPSATASSASDKCRVKRLKRSVNVSASLLPTKGNSSAKRAQEPARKPAQLFANFAKQAIASEF